MLEGRVIFRSLQTIRSWRSISKCARVAQSADLQSNPVEKLTIPPPGGSDKVFAPKIEKLVTEISQLNLIEVSELSDLLKKRLNLPDAPVMPVGGFGLAPMKDEEKRSKNSQIILQCQIDEV
ncbi:hypothetical protein JTB14_021499 [Gonioctena quinquepunctata]|nr:hypothetical protein JTB14_021499 [Gonioctena quinquepunctata]